MQITMFQCVHRKHNNNILELSRRETERDIHMAKWQAKLLILRNNRKK